MKIKTIFFVNVKVLLKLQLLLFIKIFVVSLYHKNKQIITLKIKNYENTRILHRI